MMRNKVEKLAQIDPFLITFQRRSSAGFDDTLDEEADFGEFVNPRGRQRGGKQ